MEDASGKQELTALIHALKVWRCYLEGAEFTVYVDHNPLTDLLQKPNLNRWQVRILEVLAMYPGMKIQHIPGKDNIVDGLSRIHHGPPPPPPADQPTTVTQAILQCNTGELTFPTLHKADNRPTKRHPPMKDTVAHLQALYGTAMFYQANVTRAQAKQAAKTKKKKKKKPWYSSRRLAFITGESVLLCTISRLSGGVQHLPWVLGDYGGLRNALRIKCESNSRR